MIGPRPRAWIGGGFQPAARGQDVIALVAVDVAHADAVPVGAIAHDVLRPTRRSSLRTRLAACRSAARRSPSARPSLSTSASTANSTLPPPLISNSCQRAVPPALPGIFPPGDAAGEPRDVREIRKAITVDVDGHQAEAVDVVAGETDLTKLPLRPARRLVPILTAHEIEAAVAVDVRDRGALARAGVDRMHLEWQIRRPALHGDQDETSDEQRRQAHRYQFLSQMLRKLAVRSLSTGLPSI